MLSAWAGSAQDQANYQTKTADLERIRAQIEALRAQLDAAHGERDALRTELRRIERDIGDINRRLRERDTELQARSDKLAELERARQTQRDGLAVQRHALAGQLRAAYMLGRQEYPKLLLNQQDPAALGRSLVYYDYFSRARAQRIARLNADLAQLDNLEQTIREQTARVEQLRAAERVEKETLEQSRQARREVLAQLNGAIQNRDQELQRLLDDQRQLEQLLPKLRQAMAAAPPSGKRAPFADLKGKLPWPVQGPLLATYGSPRMDGAMKWQGIIIGAPEGREVKAVAAGRVAFADWLRGFGLLTIIDHGGGYMSLYGHNQSLYKRSGDWVEAGAAIAGVGSSGGRAAPGLYFEIRRDGEPSDPLSWVSERSSRTPDEGEPRKR
ncbi:MAG: peptidoglycan DD-metalloendopeptidase family protein [Pseudomonadota bacterium]